MAVALTWNTISLASGYYGNAASATDASTTNPFCHLRGSVTGVPNPNTVVFTLGAGSRPSAQMQFFTDTNHRYAAGILTVNTNGTVTLSLAAPNTGNEPATWFLDGILIPAEA